MWYAWIDRDSAKACSSDRSAEFGVAVWWTTMRSGARSSTCAADAGGRAPHSDRVWTRGAASADAAGGTPATGPSSAPPSTAPVPPSSPRRVMRMSAAMATPSGEDDQPRPWSLTTTTETTVLYKPILYSWGYCDQLPTGPSPGCRFLVF